MILLVDVTVVKRSPLVDRDTNVLNAQTLTIARIVSRTNDLTNMHSKGKLSQGQVQYKLANPVSTILLLLMDFIP